jgi:hypothetical protein
VCRIVVMCLSAGFVVPVFVRFLDKLYKLSSS